MEVVEVCYERIEVEPFREPAGAEAKGLAIQGQAYIIAERLIEPARIRIEELRVPGVGH